MNVVEFLIDLLETRGDAAYLGEPVSQKEHALQCANFASREGAPACLVAAALLHDIGHLLPENGCDHEEKAAAWLAPHFGPDVTEPIRLHVMAKRYLCAVEPDYLARLSPASVESLALQGGPLSFEDAQAFEANAYCESAVHVRRWDELAKQPGLTVPDFAVYAPLLQNLAFEKPRPL
jgi:phosphonate degradation associated HDIG domain protein